MAIKGIELKRKWAAGLPSPGFWVRFTDPTLVELLGEAGFDWIMFDAEHSAYDLQTSADPLHSPQRHEHPTSGARALERFRLHQASAGHGCRRGAGAPGQNRRTMPEQPWRVQVSAAGSTRHRPSQARPLRASGAGVHNGANEQTIAMHHDRVAEAVHSTSTKSWPCKAWMPSCWGRSTWPPAWATWATSTGLRCRRRSTS